MRNDDENELIRLTGSNGGGRNVFNIFRFCSMLRTENFVFVFWAVFSFVAVYVLMLNEQLVGILSDANKTVQANVFVFSKINGRAVLDSGLANAHFFLMSISIPVQLIMFFMVPRKGIATEVQKNGKDGLLWAVVLFAFLLTIIVVAGPAVSARYSRVFGEHVVVALSGFAITVGFSYLMRISVIVFLYKIGVNDAEYFNSDMRPEQKIF